MAIAGVAWFAALVLAAVFGSVGLAVVLAPTVLLASASTLRRAHVRANVRPLIVAVAVLVPVASTAGLGMWVGAVVVATATIGLVVASSGTPAAGRAVLLASLPAASAGAVVALGRQDGGVAAIVVVAACLFDASNFVVGRGETGGPTGALAGSALVAVLLGAFSAVVDASLRGRMYWALVLVLVLVALLPLGVSLGQRLTGAVVVPALRRLDSLLLAGPASLVVTALLLHR